MKQSVKWLAVGIIVVFILVASLLVYKHSSMTSKTSKSNKINNSIVSTKFNNQVGYYLTDKHNRALYEYDRDSNGYSSCSGACLVAWPAYQTSTLPKLLPKNFGYLKRTDTGMYQYTYLNLPLYYYRADMVGQVNGNSIAGFTVAKP